LSPVSVNVFGYDDHRQLLRDLFAARKAAGRGFSHRAFALRVGLRSTNYLKLVMDGARNLSAEMAARFATGFGLDREESAYFCDLVAFNQAKTASERTRAYERMARYRRHRDMRKLDAEQTSYYAHWYVPAIRELAATRGFREDAAWIARTLQPRITPAQARAALKTLQALGLLTRDQDGKLVQADALVTAGQGPLGHHIVNYHRAMMERAADALDHVPREQREISSVTFGADDDALAEIKRKIVELRAEILQLATSRGTPRRVVQVSFQLFPLSRATEDDDG
jgi:uncharacterized protein (TIGR02147 family)